MHVIGAARAGRGLRDRAPRLGRDARLRPPATATPASALCAGGDALKSNAKLGLLPKGYPDTADLMARPSKAAEFHRRAAFNPGTGRLLGHEVGGGK